MLAHHANRLMKVTSKSVVWFCVDICIYSPNEPMQYKQGRYEWLPTCTHTPLPLAHVHTRRCPLLHESLQQPGRHHLHQSLPSRERVRTHTAQRCRRGFTFHVRSRMSHHRPFCDSICMRPFRRAAVTMLATGNLTQSVTSMWWRELRI